MIFSQFFIFLTAFFTSSLFFRLFITVPLLFLSLFLKKRIKNQPIHLLSFAAVTLITRDVLATLLPIDIFFQISNLIITAFYFLLLRHYTGFKKQDRYYLISNLVFMTLAILNRIFTLLPPISYWFLHLWLLANYIIISVEMYAVSEFNTREYQFILMTRRFITQYFILFQVLFLFFQFSSPFSAYVIIPLSYVLHFYTLVQYFLFEDRKTKNHVKNLEANFDSVFNFMRKIGNAITDRVAIDEVLRYVVETAVKDTRADGGVVLMADEFDDILKVNAIYGNYVPPYKVSDIVMSKTETLENFFRTTPIHLGETILGEAAESGEPIYIVNTKDDPRMVQNTKNDPLYISSIIVMPLIVSKKILGVLSVSNRTSNKILSQSDFDHIKTFADYTSLTINNLFTYMELLEKQEMEREVGIAADIQQQLLPTRLPRIAHTDIFAYSLAAKGVSGDYYDVIPLKDGKIALVICDVAGKGVPASLVMVMIRTIIYLIAGARKNAATIMTWINKGIVGKIALDRFATMSFMTYDPKTRRLEYSNAAHHPLMIYRYNTGEIESLDTDGIPIGLDKTTRYGQKETYLNKKDIICTYTDGIIEAMNSDNDQYSYESLAEVVVQNRDKSAKEITELVLEDMNQFVGKAAQHDDQTLLIMKAN